MRALQAASHRSQIQLMLAEALHHFLGHQVHVSLSQSIALETAREVGQGLIEAAAEHPCRALRRVGVEALRDGDERAFAKSWRRPDGICTISFNSRWHSHEAREHYLRALRDAEAKGLLPVGTPAGLARIRMLAPGTGSVTLDDHRARVGGAEDIAAVESSLCAALSAALDRDVAVALRPKRGGPTSVVSAREIALGLVEAATAFPGTRLRAVRVDDLSDSHFFAETVVAPPEFESTVTFGSWWHSTAGRSSYLSALRRNHLTGRLVERTPADIAAHEFMHAVAFSVPGWTDAGRVAGHPLALADELTAYASLEPGRKPRHAGRAISETATRNDHELVAEAAMDVRLNGPAAHPLSRLVHARLAAAHGELAADDRVGPITEPRLGDLMASADTALRGLEPLGRSVQTRG